MSPRSSVAQRNAATERFNYLVRVYNELRLEHNITANHAGTAVLDHAIQKQNRIIDNTWFR